jgi:peptidylprolyl isomerase
VSTSGAAASSQNAAAPVQDGPTCSADDVVVTGAFGQRPTITIPSGCTPPTQLVIKDLIKGGSDRAVQAGDHLRVNYQLVSWSDRREVDSSFAPGRSPLPVDNIGQAALVQGWNEGLIGVKEGGRRLLIVPPDKGYGVKGNPPIKGGETLVFVVDTVEVG